MRRSGEESTCLTLWLKAIEVVRDLRFVSSGGEVGGAGPRGGGAPNRLSQGRSDFQSFGSFGDLANSFQARSPGGCLLTCSGTNLSSQPSCCSYLFY